MMKYTLIQNGDYYNNLNEFFIIDDNDNRNLEPKEIEKKELDLLKKANTFIVLNSLDKTLFSEWTNFVQREKISLKECEKNKIYFTYSFNIQNYTQLQNFILALENKQITYFKIFSTLHKKIEFNCPDCWADLEWDNNTNNVEFIKHN